MAAYSVALSKHATLSGTTVDIVTLTGGWDFVEVLNRGDVPLWFRTDGTSPTASGDDAHVVMPGEALIVENLGTVRVLGDSNAYSVTGVPA